MGAFVNPWILLGILATWAMSLIAVGNWQREDGKQSERSAWLAKDNEQLANANKKIRDLNQAARDKERTQQLAIFKLGETHVQDMQVLEAQRKKDRSDIESGRLRLRIPSNCPSSSGSSSGEIKPAPTGSNDSKTTELPGKVTSDLLDLVNDADQIVKQLSFCQKILLEDRK